MQIKNKYFAIVGVLISLVFAMELIQPIAAEADAAYISNGSTITYDTSCTAAYRMYTGTMRITITDNSSTPMKGYIERPLGGDKWGYKTSTSTLLPYVVSNNKWESGVQNCPLYGYNDSNSPLIENWITENLEIGNNEEAFNDVPRNSTTLRFVFNYTMVNPNSNLTNNVIANCSYKWDINLGVLLYSKITITNLNDSSLDGQINTTLSTTSLWSLTADSKIPGYPLEITGSISLLTLAGLFIIFNRKQRGMVN